MPKITPLAICFAALVWGLGHCVTAQPLRNPFDFPIVLSGNFGEFRPNHLHSGLDFKTQQREGWPVHAVLDGYVSRIAVSPWGYGNVIYMTHGDSLVTVYAHLQRFADSLAAHVKARQYEAERFQVDLNLPPGQFVFNRGDVIGYSGNSGSSGGPHLHFEVRDARTGDVLDPLPFYSDRIKDTRPPGLQSLTVYPSEGLGVVNGSPKKLQLQPAVAKDGSISFRHVPEAWGRIGFAVNVDDYMDGASNVYGVKEIVMSVDGSEVFRSCLDRFSFDESRCINAWTDYEEWVEKRRFHTKTFVEQGNRFRFIAGKNRGFVTVDEPRTYRIDFCLTDAFGNTCRFGLDVKGKEQPVPAPDTEGTTLFHRWSDNHFGAKGIRLLVPRRSLYGGSLYFRYAAEADSNGVADMHVLHDRPAALHRPAQLSLRLRRDDAADSRQYGIVSVRNGRPGWVGGVYRDGWMDAEISELGNVYTIRVDSVAPVITPVAPERWTASQTVAFRLTDNLSGVDTWRATIDGEYALFAMDGKKSLISYAFDPERLQRGTHVLLLTVADACGNRSVYETVFEW
jgi:hypothetical protein